MTRKQRKLQREVADLLELLRLIPDVGNVDPELRTVHLDLAKHKLITGAVLGEYLLVDEHLSNEMCREFFPDRPYPELWRTKRFQAFNYHILERLYLVQKAEFVRGRIRFPKEIYKDILALNDLRNALAHSFFPENRRVRPRWKGIDIFSKKAFEQFWNDMARVSDFFIRRITQRAPRKESRHRRITNGSTGSPINPAPGEP